MNATAVNHPRPVLPDAHQPERPSWACQMCGRSWPCAKARADLLREHFADPSALQIYLALLKWEAFDDYAAAGAIPADLADRFGMDQMTSAAKPTIGGLNLSRNDLGGYAVDWNGKFIGWIHASLGDKWTAYVRGTRTGDPGRLLGRFTREEAVRHIAKEAGWREPD